MFGFLPKEKNKIIAIFISVLALSLFFYLKYFLFFKNCETNYAIIKINSYEIKAEIADNPTKMQKGLSGRNDIKENEGMIFKFREKGIYSFWMKDMNFPIDIIWLDNDKIVDISKNLLPQKNNEQIYKPSNPINLVLEIKSGLTEKIKIEIGQQINIKCLK